MTVRDGVTTYDTAGRRMTRRMIRVLSGMIVLTFAAASPARAQLNSDPQPAKATLAIVGGVLIDGHERPALPNSIVLIDGKQIVAVGTTESLKVPSGARVIDAAGYYVMPGLIDVHVHMDRFGHANYEVWDRAVIPGRLDEVFAISAKMLLMAGVTTALDHGGVPEFQLRTRDKIARGELIGPRTLVSAGWVTNMPDRVYAANHTRHWPSLNAHTVEEARAAALKTLALGPDFFKAFSGFTAEQLQVMVEEAHKKGLKVTGHSDNLLARIKAGQDWVEHGVDPDNEEAIRELVRRRIDVSITNFIQMVPGLVTGEEPGYLDNAIMKASVPPDLYAFVRNSLGFLYREDYFGRVVRPGRIQQSLTRTKRLYDAGLRIMVGSDVGASGTFHPDCTWRTMEMMVRAGIPPREVIGMATRIPAEHIGMGDRLGTIEPGRLADIIVVHGNPLVSMRELNHVAYVFKEGVQYKGQGTTVKIPAIQGTVPTTSHP